MLERIHEHIIRELQSVALADAAAASAAFAFNLIMLSIASATAALAFQARLRVILLVAYLVLSAVITAVAIVSLIMGWRMRQALLRGLLQMYGDTQVDRYYDPSLPRGHNQRHWLLMLATAVLGVATIAIPLMIVYAD